MDKYCDDQDNPEFDNILNEKSDDFVVAELDRIYRIPALLDIERRRLHGEVIVKNPGRFKICNNCDSINFKENEICTVCPGLLFDDNEENIVESAIILADREKTVPTPEDYDN